MLKIIKNLNDLDVRQLMSVYEESNIKYGQFEYGNLPQNLQILNAEQDFYAYLKLFFSNYASFYAVWEIDGVYKAALRLERYSDGLIITGLETAPNARRNGYAFVLVRALIGYLQMQFTGKLYSHVEKANVASINLHIKLGFAKIFDTATYIDGSFHSEAVTFCLEL